MYARNNSGVEIKSIDVTDRLQHSLCGITFNDIDNYVKLASVFSGLLQIILAHGFNVISDFKRLLRSPLRMSALSNPVRSVQSQNRYSVENVTKNCSYLYIIAIRIRRTVFAEFRRAYAVLGERRR